MRVNPATFAAVMVSLWAAHDIGDHLAQTDCQARDKSSPEPSEWVPAMAGHVGSYQLAQALTLALVASTARLRLSPVAVLAGSTLSAVSHAFIDRRWPVSRLMRSTGSAKFADRALADAVADTRMVWRPGMARADQALHHGCLLLSALAMSARRG